MKKPRLIVCRDADELASLASEHISRSAADAVERRGRFTLALAGGSTPQKTYARLALDGDGARVDWTKTFLFFGDERWVEPDDDRSNFKMVEETLLERA